MKKGEFKESEFMANFNPLSPEVAYTLGFFWADGYISQSQGSRNNNVRIEIAEADGENLKEIFCKFIPWKLYYRKRKGRKNQIAFNVTDGYFKKWLLEMGFGMKSFNSPNNILNHLNRFSIYFLRGLIDGDGCIYIGNKSNNQLSITSTFEQDWSYMEEFCLTRGIKFSIKRTENKSGKSSQFRITNKPGIKMIYKELYLETKLPGMGLHRKINKFKEIYNS